MVQVRFRLEGVDKAELLAALYNEARRPPTEERLTRSQAAQELTRGGGKVGMLGTTSLYLDLSGDAFDPRPYDRMYGEGTAQRVLARVITRARAPQQS